MRPELRKGYGSWETMYNHKQMPNSVSITTERYIECDCRFEINYEDH